jgi:hypothetical protein
MADRTYYRYNRVISLETKYIHLIEAIHEAELRFLLASWKVRLFMFLVGVSLRFQVKNGKIIK